MSKQRYKIATEDGAFRYKAEIGDTVDLDITKDEELAVIAAGWLEHATVTKPAFKEDK
jgi:flagellar basal body rod protein FlgF